VYGEVINPHNVTENESDSSKLSVWCALVRNKITNPIVFEVFTVSGDTFLTVINTIALLHVPVGTIFQLDGTQLHFSRRVRIFLDRKLPERWMRGGGNAFSGTVVLQTKIPGLCPSGGLKKTFFMRRSNM